jgi:hypothetical protein
MESIQIQSESYPNRCEICHKSDLFDPENNICTRCTSVKREIEPIKKLETNLSVIWSFKVNMIWMIFSLIGIVGLLTYLNLTSSLYSIIFPSTYWIVFTGLTINDYKNLMNNINHKVENVNDLNLVKEFINKNIKRSLILTAYYILIPIMLIMFFVYGYITFQTILISFLFTYVISIIPFFQFHKDIEDRIENLQIDENNIGLRDKLAIYIFKWHELGFKLIKD